MANSIPTEKDLYAPSDLSDCQSDLEIIYADSMICRTDCLPHVLTNKQPPTAATKTCRKGWQCLNEGSHEGCENPPTTFIYAV